MVVLNRIYTRTGDDGTTALGSGERRYKDDLRIEAYGTVDELNSSIGVVRVNCTDADEALDGILSRIQNDLFDLGADLCVPPKQNEVEGEALRIAEQQVKWLEGCIDALNADLPTLKSFVLPGGTTIAAHLHFSRTVCRRSERLLVTLARNEPVGQWALQYINRLSDFLFVAARFCNKTQGDVLWVPGKHRT